MNIKFSDFTTFKVMAVDGVIGAVSDLLVDDDSWQVRYLVVDVKNTLPQRRVLISPVALASAKENEKLIATSLSSQQVIDSPEIDCANPISRQYEEALSDFYGWPLYWLGRTILTPQEIENASDESATTFVDEDKTSSLRSISEICGYQIEAKNGDAGFMKDVLIDSKNWNVDFAVAATSKWLPSKGSSFATSNISSVDWRRKVIVVNLAQAEVLPAATIEAAPASLAIELAHKSNKETN
jgi:sporulation protein YlmC with PRC-barrel domain